MEHGLVLMIHQHSFEVPQSPCTVRNCAGPQLLPMDGMVSLSRPSRPAAREAVAGAVRILLDDEGTGSDDVAFARGSGLGDRVKSSVVMHQAQRNAISRSASYPALIGSSEPAVGHQKAHSRAATRQRPTNNALLYALSSS